MTPHPWTVAAALGALALGACETAPIGADAGATYGWADGHEGSSADSTVVSVGDVDAQSQPADVDDADVATDVGPDSVVGWVDATPDASVDTTDPDPEHAGTWEDPIPVTSMPFVDVRDTTAAPSPVFDVYGCALETNESGDGFVYEVTVTEPGTLNGLVDDQPGDDVDVDLHLLNGTYPDACVIRDNLGWSFPVTPGTWYVVVDTWSSEAGPPLAGPYKMVLTFEPEAVETPPDGSPAHPFVVEGFPFTHAGDTSGAPSEDFDGYACAPGTDESGPEVVYALGVAVSGVLDVSVEVGSGDVDVDVHLLSALDPEACVARDDASLSEAIAPGTWYVVADTWVNGAGDVLAGAYTLQMDFVEDQPTSSASGSPDNPVVVATFPFADSRSTLDAPSDAFDAYACAPETDESGKEVVYEVVVPAPGILQLSLDDHGGDDVDVDVHVLDALDPDACVARDNYGLAHPVEAGTWWVVVDTWVNGSGNALAGAYTLELDVVPAPDLASGCVVLFGDTRGGSSTDPQTAHQAVVAAIEARCPGATLVHSGDLVRSGSSQDDWDDFVSIQTGLQAASSSFWPVRGNHDGSWANMMGHLAPFIPDPPATSTYMQQVAPGLAVIALDSESDPGEQVGWLASRLDDPSLADHRFVVAFHRPLYPSVGGHGGYSGGQDHWAPLFQQHADRLIVISGHNHGMSREQVNGVRYLTAGGGGAPLYGCSKLHADTKFCASSHGYTTCDTDLTCLTWELDPDAGTEVIGDAFRFVDQAD